MPSLPPAPFGAASASEWLSEAAPRLSASTAPEIASRLAQIAFLTAALERRYHLPELTDAMLGDLAAPLSALPQQLVHLPASHPAHRWFQLAALAEFHGEPQLSRLVTNAIADTLGEHDASRAIECGFSPDERDELLALCLCRRGRVSRAAGALLDAQYHFEDAVALLGDRPWRDARIAAELGLANLAVSRGNYPQVFSRCSALLTDQQAADALGDVHRVALLQMRAIALRKRGAHLDALLDSWRAYDLLGSASEHRAELVVSMAETALEAGDLGAAQAAFANARREALATGAAPRVLAAAITGAARATVSRVRADAATGSAIDLEQAAAAPLVDLLQGTLAPRERVYALVTLAECRIAQGQPAAARALLHDASGIAAPHQFHDYTFRIDSLIEQISDTKKTQSQTFAASANRPAVPAATITGPHPALSRLHALAVRA